jgi:outer membrane protein assembly factor BamB
VLGHQIFMGTIDGHLISLDAKSGGLVWNVAVGSARADTGYGFTMAPLVVKDKVLIGSVGGEFGVRGFLTAIDAKTGKARWQAKLPAPDFGGATVANDVVFVPTLDGRITALATGSGRKLWRATVRAGINACPAVDGDTLLVGAGTVYPDRLNPVYELTAFRLPR